MTYSIFPQPPPARPTATTGNPLTPLSGRRIAFTTPPAYSPRLLRLLHLHSAIPLPLPTITVSPTPQTLTPFLHPSVLPSFSALAFPSRTAITSLSLALSSLPPPLPFSGPTFTLSALGRDADLLSDLHLPWRLCPNPNRIRILVPEPASPSGMVKCLGFGSGRKILCPAPLVVGLEEPPVVPDFVNELKAAGWEPVRVEAYETRWVGPGCVGELVGDDGVVDAVLFTSTAEVEGLLKGLEVEGWSWGRVRERWPEMVVGAHGPVTAKGAERFGVAVDVVGERFGSFDGVLEALAMRWGCGTAER